jgi:hypothetical protein
VVLGGTLFRGLKFFTFLKYIFCGLGDRRMRERAAVTAGLWLGGSLGREADFSTARPTVGLWTASVEMTGL